MTRALIGLACLFAFAASARATEPAKIETVRIEQRLGEQVPADVRFRDDAGRDVSLGDYFGDRPIILILGYYRCPRLCSLALIQLVDTLRQLDYEVGERFTIVFVSIDPREQPDLAAAKKQACIEAYGRPRSASGWHFLTGEETESRRLADAVGFRYFHDLQKDEYAHAGGLIVLTPAGRVTRYFYGLDYPARDLQYGLEDASSRRIGSPVAQPLRMLCFDYDPVTDRYTLQVMRLLRIGSVVMVMGLGLVLWRHWRGDRRALREVKP